MAPSIIEKTNGKKGLDCVCHLFLVSRGQATQKGTLPTSLVTQCDRLANELSVQSGIIFDLIISDTSEAGYQCAFLVSSLGKVTTLNSLSNNNSWYNGAVYREITDHIEKKSGDRLRKINVLVVAEPVCISLLLGALTEEAPLPHKQQLQQLREHPKVAQMDVAKIVPIYLYFGDEGFCCKMF